MSKIYSEVIYKCIKELCLKANIRLPREDYDAICTLYNNENNKNAKILLSQILDNAICANKDNRPLCQDTGFVTVFFDIGQNVQVIGDSINASVNNAVSDAYKEYFLRKSIVNNPLDRVNTNTNTPVLIHTNIVDGDEIKVILSVKGGGCENVSALKMLTPAQGLEGIKSFVLETINSIGSKSCPPMKIGIGIGSNFEGAAILSKKALFAKKNEKYLDFSNELLRDINNLEIGAMGVGGNSTCFGVNILSEPCHIASLPVAISVSCHSSRHAQAIIKNDNILFEENVYDFKKPEISLDNIIDVATSDVEKIKSLNKDTFIALSGKIYVARDIAHKKLVELIRNNQQLPFDIKNSIIFYAGPCPNMPNEIIGPIGPTTSARMDVYTPELYKVGLLASIGKGERSNDVCEAIRKANGKYFTITGGVASLLKNCVKASKIIAYPELGPEAIYELEVEKLPVMVQI